MRVCFWNSLGPWALLVTFINPVMGGGLAIQQGGYGQGAAPQPAFGGQQPQPGGNYGGSAGGGGGASGFSYAGQQQGGGQSYPAPSALPSPSPGAGGYPSPGPAFPSPGPSYPSPGPAFPSPGPSYPSPGPAFPSPGPSYPSPGPSFPQPAPGGYGGGQAPQPIPQPQPQPQPYPNPAPLPSPSGGGGYPSPGGGFPGPSPAISYPGQSVPGPSAYPGPGPSFPQPAPGGYGGQAPQPIPQPQPSPGGYGGPQPVPQPFPQPAPGGYGPQPVPAPAPGGYGPSPVLPSPGGSYPGGGTPGGTAGPDLSDPCFRRYANCIIVNAQPYERRSTIDVQACKDLCTASAAGVFQCRSFVYDNQNQVCDLFGHTGNQYPAKLITFYNRDYYEPTGTCGDGGGAVTTDPYGGGVTNAPVEATTTGATSGTTAAAVGPTCPLGQEARLLRIEGFMLQGSDDTEITGVDISECIAACFDNQLADGTSAPCQSFDFDPAGTCLFTQDAAVPTGNGQLVQNPNSDYYEKICVDAGAVANCPEVFERFPQMILVGFAETVVDANSFEECLDNCLNAQTLYGFRCASGMFYFQEDQLNCILNTEDRTTQPDLFVQEDNDIVDYFETGCALRNQRLTGRRRLGQRGAVIASNFTEIVADSRRFVDGTPNLTVGRRRAGSSIRKEPTTLVDFQYEDTAVVNADPAFGQWTQWSPCDRSKDGRRVRYKRCRKSNLKDCDAETEWCNRESLPENTRNLDALAHAANASGSDFQCPPNECCAVFGGCRIGLRKDATTGTIRWCTNPCQ